MHKHSTKRIVSSLIALMLLCVAVPKAYAVSDGAGNEVFPTSNVGIGTTTPQAALAVTGNVGIGTWIADNGRLIVIGGNVGIGTKVPRGVLEISSATSPSSFVTIETSGNVGIGTTTTTGGLSIMNGNVGIGTWKPRASLFVNGLVGIGGTDGSTPLYVSGGGYATSFFQSGASMITPRISLGLGYTSVVGPTNGLIVEGNTGIGTINPRSMLTVNGAVGIGTANSSFVTSTAPAGGLMVEGNVGVGTITPQTKFAVVGGNVGIGTWTADGGNLIVNGGGNVGIGSAWPGAMVDVIGTVRAVGFTLPGGASAGYLLTSTSTGMGTWTPPNTTVTNAGVANQMAYYSATGTALSGTSNLTVLGSNIGIGTLTTVNVGIGTTTPGAALAVLNNVGIGTWTADSGRLIVMGGNVGIGTRIPDSLLYISGLNPSITIEQNGGSTSKWILFKGATNSYVGQADGSDGIATGSIAGDLVFRTATRNILMSVDGGASSAMYIASSANVGIGTRSPRALLDVTGSSATTAPMIFTSTGNLGVGTITADGGQMIVRTGNVGVGTAWPGTTLDVIGTVRAVGFTLPGGASGGYVLTSTATGMGTWMPASGGSGSGTVNAGVANQMAYYSATGTALSGTSNITILGSNIGIGTLSTVNVGIGTTTPGAALAVLNNVGIGTWTADSGRLIVMGGNVGIGTATPRALLEVNSGSLPGGILSVLSGGNVGVGTTFGNGGLMVMNGNVGIGTWSPTAKLQVNGTTTSGKYQTTGASASGTNAIALGSGSGVNAGNDILASNSGSMAVGYISGTVGTPANILASGLGSVAIGYSESTDVSSIIRAQNSGSVALGAVSEGSGAGSDLTSSGIGSIAMGYAQVGTLKSSGFGSVAMGYSGGSGETLQSTGQASVAIGQAVQATANNAFALGLNFTNLTASTFKVGFAATPTLTVTAANVGIGTFEPFGGKLIVSGGNVGVGSLSPGTLLDVIGTVRAVGFTLPGGASAGYLLVSSSTGMGTWMPMASTGASGAVNAGTQNRLAFYATTGTAVSDQTIIYTDSTNIGIGTAGPSTLLDVNRKFNVKSDGNVGIGSNVPRNLLEINSSSLPGGIFNVSSGGNIGIGTTTAVGGLSIMSGNLGVGTFDPFGGKLIVMGGNTGIGTTLPRGLLEVNNASAPGGFMTVDTSGNVGIGTILTSSSGASFMNGNVGIGTWKPLGQFVVKAGGNVGLGTVNPQTAVHLYGVNTADSSSVNMHFDPVNGNNDNTTGFLNVRARSNPAVNATRNLLMFRLVDLEQGAPYIQIENQNGAGSMVSYVIFGVRSSGSPFFQGGSAALPMRFEQAGGGLGDLIANNIGLGTTTMPGGSLIVFPGMGNVGIQTIRPGATLDVVGTVRAVGFTLPGGASDGYVLTSTATGMGTWMPNAATGTVGSGVANQMAYYSATGTAVSGTSNITILGSNIGIGTLSAVNVGIGTFTPVGGLAIMSGNVGIGTFDPFGGKLIVMGGNTGIGTTKPRSLLEVNSSSAPGGFLAVNSSGNVGIGTVSPLGAFVVTSGNVGIGTFAPNNILSIPAGNVGIGTTLSVDAVFTIASLATTDLFKVNDNGLGDATPFVIKSDGNVGIGTTTPQVLLAVLGNVGIGTWTAEGGNLIVKGGGNVGIGSSWPGQVLDVNGAGRFAGSGDSYLNSAGGNVGIGSVTPGQKLDVNGAVRFNGNLIGLATSNVGIGTSQSANQACDTTCTFACLWGFDNGTGRPTPCSATTSDTCFCLGAN